MKSTGPKFNVQKDSREAVLGKRREPSPISYRVRGAL